MSEEQVTDEQLILMAFYSVETLSELVKAQTRHIEKLQATLAKLQTPLPKNYWTGPSPRKG